MLGALIEVVVSPETLTSALDIEMELAVIETELPPTVMVIPSVLMTIEFSPTCKVIDCPAVVSIDPAVTSTVWLPWLTVMLWSPWLTVRS